MAEELTSGLLASATPNEPGQSQTSEVAAPQSAPAEEPGRQVSDPKPVNLHELPEFRRYQSEQDKKLTALQRELEATRAQQQQAAMAQMTPEQRMQYQVQMQQQELQRYQQMVQQQEIAQQRQKDIDKLSQMSGAPSKVFEAAETYDDAVIIAMNYMRENSPQAIAARQEKAAANKVDLGGGGQVVTAEDARQREMNAALAKGDSRTYFKMLLES
jgi:hypothetical protein